MKLYFSPASPFVRKVMICAAELGLTVETLPSQAHPVQRDRTIVADNPLGQVPTFFAGDGTVLYDSRVICEYLDDLAGGGRLFPASGPERWRALVEQSLGDGLLDAALLARYEEVVRPAEVRHAPWLGGQMDKIDASLSQMDVWASSFGDRVDIGTITLACALGYLDFRFPTLSWRDGRSGLATWYAQISERPSVAGTAPH